MNQTLLSSKIRIENCDSFKFTRAFLISLLQVITFTIFLSLLLIAHFHTPLTTPIPQVSISQQEIRGISLFFGSVFLMVFIWILVHSFLNKKITTKNRIFILLSLIPFLDLLSVFANLYYALKTKTFILYFKFIFQSQEKNNEIDVKYFFKNFLNKKAQNRLFINTAVFLIVLCITTISFAFIMLPPTTFDKEINDPFRSWFFGKFSYFTEWTNFLCFFFCVLFLINHKWKIFKNDLFLHGVSIYIIFVFLIFWFILMPGTLFIRHAKFDFHKADIINWVFSIWFHLVTPIAFVSFALINTYFWRKSDELKINSYFKLILIYPFTFAIYAYSLPFVANVTIYGLLTNPNPNNKPFGDTHPGEYWHLTFILILLLIFLFLVFVFYKLVKKILKHSKIDENIYLAENL